MNVCWNKILHPSRGLSCKRSCICYTGSIKTEREGKEEQFSVSQLTVEERRTQEDDSKNCVSLSVFFLYSPPPPLSQPDGGGGGGREEGMTQRFRTEKRPEGQLD